MFLDHDYANANLKNVRARSWTKPSGLGSVMSRSRSSYWLDWTWRARFRSWKNAPDLAQTRPQTVYFHGHALFHSPPRCHPGTQEKAAEDFIHQIKEPTYPLLFSGLVATRGWEIGAYERITKLNGIFFFGRGAPRCSVKDHLFSTLFLQKDLIRKVHITCGQGNVRVCRSDVLSQHLNYFSTLAYQLTRNVYGMIEHVIWPWCRTFPYPRGPRLYNSNNSSSNQSNSSQYPCLSYNPNCNWMVRWKENDKHHAGFDIPHRILITLISTLYVTLSIPSPTIPVSRSSQTCQQYNILLLIHYLPVKHLLSCYIIPI